MTVPDRGVVIVGAGHAGGTAAALLRQYGYEPPRKTQYHATQPVRSSYERTRVS